MLAGTTSKLSTLKTLDYMPVVYQRSAPNFSFGPSSIVITNLLGTDSVGLISRFPQMQQRRGSGAAMQLAEALQGMSSGHQPHVRVSNIEPQLVFVAGSKDKKFVALAMHMTQVANGDKGSANGVSNDAALCQGSEDIVAQGQVFSRLSQNHAVALVTKNCGHAVHLEQPERVVHLLQSLLDKGHMDA